MKKLRILFLAVLAMALMASGAFAAINETSLTDGTSALATGADGEADYVINFKKLACEDVNFKAEFQQVPDHWLTHSACTNKSDFPHVHNFLSCLLRMIYVIISVCIIA